MDSLYAQERSFSSFKTKILDTPVFDLNIPNVADKFLLSRNRNLGYGEFYTPFDYVNESAEIVIVGMSPNSQWKEGLNEARECLLDGLCDEETLCKAKEKGAFSGGIRERLIKELDVLEVNKAFGLQSCSELFDKQRHRAHLTSCFVNCLQSEEENNCWGNPSNNDIAKEVNDPFFTNCLREGFLKELSVLKKAKIFLPLGKPACLVFEKLIKHKFIEREKVILGLQHPSTGNGHFGKFVMAENSPNESFARQWQALRQQMKRFL